MKTFETSNTNHKKAISFKTFFAMYAALEKWDHIPSFHFDIVDFLENDSEWTNNTAVLQVFRNAAKSTLVAAYVAWKMSTHDSLRVLIQSADEWSASKMLNDIKHIVEYHPLCAHLGSGKYEVVCKGIFSNSSVGAHDIVVYDDVEVPRNCSSEEQRSRIRARVSESAHLLNPNGLRLFVGTPPSQNSICDETINSGASSKRITLLEKLDGEFPHCTGQSNWQERFSVAEINKMQKMCRSRAEFLSQYQLA